MVISRVIFCILYKGKVMKKIINIVFMLVISTVSFSEIISLDKALEMAIKENVDIKIHALEIRKKEFEVNKKRKKFLPELNIIYGENDYSDSYDPFEHHSGGDDEIVIKMPLFMGFENQNQLKKSKLELERSREDSSRLEAIIRQSVISKYFQILNLQKQEKILMTAEKSLEERNQRLIVLYKHKKVLHEKVLASKANISYNQAQVLTIRVALENAISELKFLLNMSIGEKIELLDNEKIETFFIIENISIKDDLAEELTRGSRLRKSKIDIELLELDVKIAQAKYYPKVWVEASNNYTYNDKNKDHSRISIMAEWNIFRWGADSDTVEQKKISVEQSKLLQIKIRQDAHMELKGKYDNIKRIKSEQKTQKYLLQASREKFERADVRYKNNQITYSEYINILNFLQSNENRYYELKQEFIQAIDDYKNREE